MSDKLKDGGTAFPADRMHQTSGMSLRDWFAGQIANGMAAYSGTTGMAFGPGDIAKRSYEVADAMLSARQQKDENDG